ncbi:MAG: ribonuclease Z [Bacteroidales bacterium]|nr:ribonuclease Z [Bacteroidales bacterium]
MKFSITILGCNSAIPTLHRNPSAQILNVHESLFLIDCAEGTQIQLLKYKIRLQRINHILISHLHGDHYFGLIGLLSSFHLLGRKNEIHVYAQEALKKILDIQLLASETKLTYPLIFHPINPEVHENIFEDDKLCINTFPVKHSIPTCGFLFKEKQAERNIRKEILSQIKIPYSEFDKIKKGADYISPKGVIYKNADLTLDPPPSRSYAYCTDTCYYEQIIPHIKDVDLLYHEATFMQNKAKSASEKFHSTTKDAATIAKKANVKKLVIGHYSSRYDDLEPLLSEAKNEFPNTYLAEDGKVFEID